MTASLVVVFMTSHLMVHLYHYSDVQYKEYEFNDTLHHDVARGDMDDQTNAGSTMRACGRHCAFSFSLLLLENNVQCFCLQ